MKRLLSLWNNFEYDHWRLAGAIRLLFLLAAGTCLIVGLDKITTWLLK